MKKILVIEDEPSVRESLLDLLEAEGFESIGGENGRFGVQLASEHRPDLILCDVQMPDLDGYSVLTHLRESPETADIPFIFLTARSRKSDIRYGMELGADDYLTKPCTAPELLGAISGRLAKQAAILERYNQQALNASRNPDETVLQAGDDGAQSNRTRSEFSQGADYSSTRDGLLNHFYQELRNPLSKINMVLHLLKTPLHTVVPSETIAMVQTEYGRELAILQQVYKLQNFLVPESVALLRYCNLDVLFDSDLESETA